MQYLLKNYSFENKYVFNSLHYGRSKSHFFLSNEESMMYYLYNNVFVIFRHDTPVGLDI